MLHLDFTAAGAAAGWAPVNDAVMGGRSASTFLPSDGGAAFAGEVSFENGGGFASVRTGSRRWPTGGARGFTLVVRGDGQRYRFTLRGDDEAIQYQAGFVAPADWSTVELALADFVPRHRGRSLANAPPLRAEDIRTLGFLIADRQAGPFRLEIASIAARA
jgi:monofunctional biosynthetic peptidoglycan transglycosylase